MIYLFIFVVILSFSLLAVLKTRGFYILKSFSVVFLFFEYSGFGPLFLSEFSVRSYGNLANYSNEIIVLFTVNSIILTLTALLIFFGKSSENKTSVVKTRPPTKGLLLLKCFVIFIVAIYLSKLDWSNLPLIVKLNGGSIYDVAQARHNSGNEVSGFTWYKYCFRDLGLFILLFQIIKDKGMNSHSWFWVLCLISFSLITGEKMPMVELVVFIFIVRKFIIRGDKPQVRLAFLLIIIIVSTYPILPFLYDRLLVGQIIPGIYYLKYFDINSLLYGSSIPNPGGMFPYSPVELTVLIMEYSGMNSSVADLGVKGTMPFLFWGELLANFGWLGVLFGIPLILLYLYVLDIVLWSYNSPYISSLYLYLAFLYKDLAVTGFSQFIYLWQLVIIVISIFILKKINGKKKKAPSFS